MLSKLSGLLKIFVLNFYLYHSWSFLQEKNFQIKSYRRSRCKGKRKIPILCSLLVGYSLNSLSTSEIEYINANDVITFNNSHMQDVINSTFHLSRRIGSWRSTKNDNRFRQSGKDQISYLNEFKSLICLKPFYSCNGKDILWSTYLCFQVAYFRNIKIYPYETIKDVGFVRRKQILNTLYTKLPYSLLL